MGLFNRKPKAAPTIMPGSSGFGEAVHIVYNERRLDIGKGTNTFAYDTLALPTYSPIGWGCQPKRSLKSTQGGIQFSTQGITLTTLGDPGNLTGMFVSQPLVDLSNNNSAVSIPLAPNNAMPQGSQS